MFEDDKTLGSYGIEEIQKSPFYFVQNDHILIFVKTLMGNMLPCWVPPDATVESVKEEVYAITGISSGMTYFNSF